MNFEVYAYWNIEELTATFNAVAALMGSGDYLGLLRTLALVGILDWSGCLHAFDQQDWRLADRSLRDRLCAAR